MLNRICCSALFSVTLTSIVDLVSKSPTIRLLWILAPRTLLIKLRLFTQFYSEPSSNCEMIDKGTSCFYYDMDMGLIHCNDSFVDARIQPLTCNGRSISDDLALLNDKFDRLRRFIAQEPRTRFESRKDRCFFCTKFVMTDASKSLTVPEMGRGRGRRSRCPLVSRWRPEVAPVPYQDEPKAAAMIDCR